MSLQLLHDSRATTNVKMLQSGLLESVANPTTIISMSSEWGLFSSTGEETRAHSSGEAT